jgi:anti-anti-sigma factor
MDPSELRRWAIEQLTAPSADRPPRDLVLDLSGVDHLDASALQVLLAIRAEEQQRGGCLQLVNPSVSLRRWFDYAGAASLLALAAPPPSTPTEEASRCEKF